jgi:hypothetical protein
MNLAGACRNSAHRWQKATAAGSRLASSQAAGAIHWSQAFRASPLKPDGHFGEPNAAAACSTAWRALSALPWRLGL